MCTLIALHRWIRGAPLVVAANRDEYLERPAEGPALRVTPSGPIVAPLDAQAGGTWFGLNAHGVFAGVTNRAGARPDPRRKSRGLLVIEALGATTARESVEKLESLAAETYNPFNLFVADRDRAFALTCGDSVRRFELGAGVHVIGNGDLEALPTPKVARLTAEAERAASSSPDDILERLSELCRDHGGDTTLTSACVHAGGYGTRSSTLLKLSAESHRSEFHFADGAPCRTAYGDFTPLLREVGLNRPFLEGEQS
jgi:uncharacterized protein with NRDE domain